MVDDFVKLIEPLARHFFGEPNRRLSHKGELRFGTHGSLSINLKKGTWFDHETQDGGGALDLVRRQKGFAETRDVMAWLEAEGYVANSGNGHDKGHGRLGAEIARYDYEDEAGELLFQVVRYEPKDFRQRRPDGAGGWAWSIKGVRQVPYRLPELSEALASDRVVFIVEGEKDADNLWRIGVPATTNAQGAGKWPAEINPIFAGADVVIIADNDPQQKDKAGKLLFHDDGRPKHAGQDHANAVAAELQGIARRVRVLDLGKAWEGCPPKGDISDWIAAGSDAGLLYQWVETLQDWTPPIAPVAARPFEYVDLAAPTIPPRAWLVLDRIPAGAVTLFSGQGAIGKSLLILQLCAATVLGRDWITMLPERGPAIYYSAEEDNFEIMRRSETIAGLCGGTRADLRDAGLWAISRAGSDAILSLPDRSGIIRPTPMFNQLRTDALRIRPKLIAIDTAADVFAGNEIDRSQTRQFITLLRGLAMETGAAVILLSHPSLAGIKSASGLSGSTAWHNSVRARMYLAAVTSKDEDDDDDVAGAELRKLQFVKNNYGPASSAVVLRWRNGIFAPEPGAGSIDAVAAAAKADDVFMTLLRRFTIEGRTVSHNGSNKHAPSLFAKEEAAKTAGIKKQALGDAMARLFNGGRLKVHTEGAKSHKRSFLVEVEK